MSEPPIVAAEPQILILVHAIRAWPDEDADSEWQMACSPILDDLAVCVLEGDPVPPEMRAGFWPGGDLIDPEFALLALRNLRECPQALEFLNDLDALGGVQPTVGWFARRFRDLFPGGIVTRGRSAGDWNHETSYVQPNRRLLFGWPLHGHTDAELAELAARAPYPQPGEVGPCCTFGSCQTKAGRS